ncbi:hypothetical protein L211DRAFT_32411 [Terfezia boudieri ATCC MYA-4762]|uniref:Uncharacterized protein n=1 Tax=Terfezia boudieri ATCC MYA-4762 TaxID=1051890 RepID=A0A3N4M3N3_9PEZI|nr:hypothetical protein L211DRAFT_32411 [Terfezia boudieri ATCC MYA-4762]
MDDRIKCRYDPACFFFVNIYAVTLCQNVIEPFLGMNRQHQYYPTSPSVRFCSNCAKSLIFVYLQNHPREIF